MTNTSTFTPCLRPAQLGTLSVSVGCHVSIASTRAAVDNRRTYAPNAKRDSATDGRRIPRSPGTAHLVQHRTRPILIKPARVLEASPGT
ncbi:hypothetical protein OBBRIDRAFT_136590 [Obba rivulosa]|uniref:Uncharacterized protein n=1 Tax=Obba rivulosa TaxID=1052685 RepID=A0A8E2DM85_9APHY|nr:hypothetical protein OBBRIDRAFT_136590 [Obba rivulosa]